MDKKSFSFGVIAGAGIAYLVCNGKKIYNAAKAAYAAKKAAMSANDEFEDPSEKKGEEK